MSGADTCAPGRARTDHAPKTVLWGAFWLKSTKTRRPRSSFHHAEVISSGRRRSSSRAAATAAARTCARRVGAAARPPRTAARRTRRPSAYRGREFWKNELDRPPAFGPPRARDLACRACARGEILWSGGCEGGCSKRSTNGLCCVLPFSINAVLTPCAASQAARLSAMYSPPLSERRTQGLPYRRKS